MILDDINKSLQIKIPGAVTTNALVYNASWVDMQRRVAELEDGQQNDGTISDGTAVTAIDAPTINYFRKIGFLSVFNADTVAQTVTVIMKSGATQRTIATITLEVAYTLYYEYRRGWYVLDDSGAEVVTEVSLAAIAIGNTVTGAIINEVLYVDASGLLQQLHVATYPSLTELSYVKGLSSALQTQLAARELLANKDTDGTMAANSDTKYASQKASKTYGDRAVIPTLQILPLYALQGFLINGKIVPSVSASDLIVAIKTMAGTDPSATDPVYCRIGDTVRSITAALSVTCADGTNWFNAGGAELATNEIDYFVYLGYNATDGVVIGFSRLIYASQYSIFSATSTNEKYAAISNITTAASTDYYELVGRFAATLSAGAGYTWTVPTFTSINLINRPIYHTRRLTYTPVHTRSGTGYTNVPSANTNAYKLVEGKCFIDVRYTQNAVPGGTLFQLVSVPWNAVSANLPGPGLDQSLSVLGMVMVLAGTNSVRVYPSGATASSSYVMQLNYSI